MTITRNGVEIELTDMELCQAWMEVQLENDVEEIEYMIEGDDDVSDDLIQDTEFVKRLAKRWRMYMDNTVSGDERWDCYRDALADERSMQE